MSISLPTFSATKILVIGDIMLDRYWSGGTSRISPEAPVPVVKVSEIENKLGGAANVALNLATLGCQVSICGIIGSDEAGETIQALLKQTNIKSLLTANPATPTITKLRILSRHQQLLRMDFEENLEQYQQEALTSSVEEEIRVADAVVISDYAKGTVANPQAIIQMCKDNGVMCLVDPKGKDFSRYTNASYITPNLSELEDASSPCPTIEDAIKNAQTLCKQLALQGLLVTLSEKGMALVETDKDTFHLPTNAKDVFDVTGAGDTVIATLAACLATNVSTHDAVRLSNLAASVVVGKLGTSTVSPEELRTAIELEDSNIPKGKISLSDLQVQVEQCRKKGERIVFTNGCFDILHAGHVRYLKAAAELGDKLIVGMNSDASIKRLKGNERPIVSLDERMEVMSSLRCVDWVIPFEEDTPLKLIQAIVPDVLTKGGDYIAHEIVGYDTVTEAGGEVKVLTFVDGCSTTGIVEKIKALS